MKPIIKKAIIASAVVVGSVLAFNAFGIVGFSQNALYSFFPYPVNSSTYDLSEIKNLSVNDINSDVFIIPWNEDHIRISYYANQPDLYDINRSENGNLNVSHIPSEQWDPINGLFFINQNRSLTIAIPRKFIGQVDVSTVSGNITLSYLDLSDALNLNTTSGEIYLKAITADGAISSTSVSGGLDLKKIRTNSNLKIATTSGGVEIASSQVAGELSFNSISNDLILLDTKIDSKVSLNNKSGSLEFSQLVADDLFMKTISGNISGTIIGEPNNYSITANTVSGNINLPPSGIGNQELDVSTISGNINIEFRP